MKSKTYLLVLLTISMIVAGPAFSHGNVDQQYSGPFAFDLGLNAGGGVSQGFVPTASNLVAVDLFLTGNGSNPSLPLTVNIRAASFDGPILGTATVILPAGISAGPSNPYVLHVDYALPISLTPGSSYYIQIEPDAGFGLGAAASYDDGYPNGAGYQGDFTLPGLDFGFRTYAGTLGPATKDDCKNGGWATFTSPSFKNQGDCIQFVNTGK